MDRRYEESELIINPDGSVFHLHMKPEDVGEYVFLAGDPGRIRLIASHFDKKLSEASNREFFSITGMVGSKKVTALSTGIGTDNIDIVLGELDALVNIDFSTRREKAQKTRLKLIRIGTSGAIQEDIVPGSSVISRYVIGFDGLLNFYQGLDGINLKGLQQSFMEHTNWPSQLAEPYCLAADPELLEQFGGGHLHGTTISAPGFYGPQGRELRAGLAWPEVFACLPDFRYKDQRITNFEMECSALYGLSQLLGHQALTVCSIIANRRVKQYVGDYQSLMKTLVAEILNRL